MRFALLGTHPDGVSMANALVDSGRHEMVAYGSAQPLDAEVVARWGAKVRPSFDLEEMLADPAIEAVIVAGSADNRPTQLRRALQSERHVLCVHPADDSPDLAYEASLLRKDTGKVLLPLLPEALHPAVLRLAELVQSGVRPLVRLRLIEVERWATAEVCLSTGKVGMKPVFPGWDVLRRLGGEIAEVSALAEREEVEIEEPVLIAGSFERGGMFQSTFLPYQNIPRWRVVAVGTHGRAELTMPLGWGGPALLSWHGPEQEWHEESWDVWDPWMRLVEEWERALAGPSRRSAPGPALAPSSPTRTEAIQKERPIATGPIPAEARSDLLTWQDAVRCLELDDAARRSVERRRSSRLEYQEVSEEVGFKGTMTLVGCGLVWLLLALVIVANWFPWVIWIVVPLLLGFLGLQMFRWVLPRSPGQPKEEGP